MEYVIDASVAVKWFVPEPYSEKADQLSEEYLHQGLRLSAPDLLVAEVGNTLWKRSVLRKELLVSEAQDSHADFLNLHLPLEPSSAIAEEALNLATREVHKVYDALYVVLAVKRGCQFITADETLINKLSGKVPQILSLSSL